MKTPHSENPSDKRFLQNFTPHIIVGIGAVAVLLVILIVLLIDPFEGGTTDDTIREPTPTGVMMLTPEELPI